MRIQKINGIVLIIILSAVKHTAVYFIYVLIFLYIFLHFLAHSFHTKIPFKYLKLIIDNFNIISSKLILVNYKLIVYNYFIT